MKYLLTGGGTGGHIYPALAIADELRRRQPEAEFLYVGLRDKLESRVVPGRGYPIQFVCSRPFPRSSSIWAMAIFVLALVRGILKGMVILLRFRPQLIIGTGGYVSAPVLFAASLLSKLGLGRAKVFLYEPNAYPGMLNQLAGRMAHRIGVAFERTARWFDMKRVAVVGYPVRRQMFEVERVEARRRLDIPLDKKVVLAFGGSGGARPINEALVEALPLLRQREEVLVLHVTGRAADAEYDAVRDTERALLRQGIEGDTRAWYRRFDYLEDIQYAYRAADLVICRGGAGTLTEVGVCGLPALIVPLPTATEDHQALNARELERQGAARVLYQEACWQDGRVVSSLDGRRLAGEILDLLVDESRRCAMAREAHLLPLKDSLGLILGELENLAGDRRPLPLSLEFRPPAPAFPADPNHLLGRIKQRLLEVGGVAALDPRELDYLRYQADRLLVSEEWYEIPLGRRNVGVKLVGCLEYQRQLPMLLQILRDRSPASWLQRLFGGDFRHCGLLRRNVIEQAILPLGAVGEQVKLALIQALREDPYFEVRAAAAQTLGSSFAPDPQLEQALIAALEDRAPGVVLQAIRALGRIAQQSEALEHLQRFYLDDNWRFRQEVVESLIRLVERDLLAPATAAIQVHEILTTSPFFRAEFPLDEKLRELALLVERKEAEKRDEQNCGAGR